MLNYKIKAPPQNLISNLFYLAFQESPCYHRLVSLQIDSRPSQVVTHQKPGKSDVALQNISPPKSHIQPVLLGISDSFKKESPCYHRLVSLQIDSRPSQVVTHQKPGKSDVALQNKSPPKSHIKCILLGISDSFKKESPCYHRPLFCNATSDLPDFGWVTTWESLLSIWSETSLW